MQTVIKVISGGYNGKIMRFKRTKSGKPHEGQTLLGLAKIGLQTPCRILPFDLKVQCGILDVLSKSVTP